MVKNEIFEANWEAKLIKKSILMLTVGYVFFKWKKSLYRKDLSIKLTTYAENV